MADVEQPDIKDMKGMTIVSGFHYKGLNYVGLIPVLVSAVKEKQAKIDSLSHVITNRLDALEAKLNGCCGSGDANKTDTVN